MRSIFWDTLTSESLKFWWCLAQYFVENLAKIRGGLELQTSYKQCYYITHLAKKLNRLDWFGVPKCLTWQQGEASLSKWSASSQIWKFDCVIHQISLKLMDHKAQ